MNQLIDVAARANGAGSPVDLMIALFVIGVLPVIAVSMTSFTRIIVVLGLLRASVGAPSLPPNIVLAALALALTCVVMSPTLARIGSDAIDPYAAHRITAGQAFARAAKPLRAFMARHVR